MNKTFPTVAILLAACGTCAAQSSVTIYGVVDLGITKTSNGNSLSPASGTPGQWNEQSGLAPRLGFRGREDLGDGLYTRFDLQARYTMDNGAASTPFWGGRSVVAIGNRYGEIYLGREYTPASAIAIAADPTGWNYISQITNYTYAYYNGGTAAADGTFFRRSNTVALRTATFDGLSAEVAVAAGEGAHKRTQGFNVQYKGAPYYVGVGYDGTDGDNRMWLATVGYDFGFIRPVLSYASAKGGQSSLYKGAKDLALTASMPVGLGRLFFGGARLRPIVDNSDSTKLLAGYEYYLSKRTTLYTNIASAKTDGFTSDGTPRRRTSGVDFGITHSF